jgi:hypothetical protein
MTTPSHHFLDERIIAKPLIVSQTAFAQESPAVVKLRNFLSSVSVGDNLSRMLVRGVLEVRGEYSELVKRPVITSLLGLSLLLCPSGRCQFREVKPDSADLTNAQTVAYCEILNHPEAFKNKLIRVRALYETDFELAAITAPSCSTATPMTWVEFEKGWEHRTRWRVRRAIGGQQWRVQMDVVIVGIFRTDGDYGHMDMYPFLFDVYKVESIRLPGSFRPLPEQKNN